MALAKGTRGTGEPTPRAPKKKKQLAVPPMGVRLAEGTTPYRGSTSSYVPQDIHWVNRRVQTITDSFERSHGYRPSPGLVFDFLRAGDLISDDEIPDLFQTPVTAARARAANLLRRENEGLFELGEPLGEIEVEEAEDRGPHVRAEGLRGEAMARFYIDARNFTRAPAFERIKNEAEEEQERRAARRAMTEALTARYGSNESMNALQVSIAARKIAEGDPWDLYGDRINPSDPIGQAALVPDNPFFRFLGNVETEAGDILRGTPPAILTVADATVHDMMNLDDVARGRDSQLTEDVINPQLDYFEGRYVTPFAEKGVGGGLKDVAKSFYEQPVSGALDVFAAGSIGARAAVAAGRAPKPRQLTLKPEGAEGVTVHPWQSPNPLTAYLENVFDRATERWPVGMRATARVSKEKSREIKRGQDRAKAGAANQAGAIRHISFNPVKNAQLRNLLYWEAHLPPSMRNREGLQALREDVRRGPGEYVEEVSAQIEAKRAEMATLEKGSQEARKLGFEISALEKKVTPEAQARYQKGAEKRARKTERAIETQAGMSAKERRQYEAAVESAAEFTRQVEEIKIEAGLITREQAEARRALIARRLFGEGAEPSDIFVGHRAKPGQRSVARLGRSRVGGGPISTKGMGLQKNELALWRTGRVRVDPDVILEDWMRAQTFKFHSDIKQYFGQVAQPIGPDGPNPGWYLVNPKGKTKPGHWDDAVEAADPEGLLDALKDYVGGYVATNGAEAKALLGKSAPGDILQLDPTIAHAFYNRYVGPQGAAAGLGAITTGTDLAFGLVKLSLVYANPGYIPANLAGNIVFGVAHQGPFLATNMYKAGKAMVNDPELFRLARAEVGVGPTAAISSPETFGRRTAGKAVLAGEQKAARGIGLIPDVVPRVAAWYYEAEKAGFKTRAEKMALLTKEEFARQRDQIGRTAEEAMVNFDLMGPVEKAVLGRAFFVWPWIRGAARWSYRFPMDRPVRADVLATLAEGQAAAQDKALPDKEPWAEEMIQLEEAQRGPIRRVVNFGSISPTGTSLGLVSAIQELAHGDEASRFHSPGSYLNPLYGALFNSLEGKGPFGEPLSVRDAFIEHGKELTPIAKIINEVRNPPESNTYVDQSKTGILKRRVLRFAPQDIRVEGITQVTAESKEEADRRERVQRLKDEIYTVLAMEDMTAQIIGRPVPEPVKDAIGLLGLFEREYADFAIREGREPTPQEKALLQIDRLEKEQRVGQDEASGLRERLGIPRASLLGTRVGLARKGEIEGVKLGTEEFPTFNADFKKKYLNEEALQGWYGELYSVLDVAKGVQEWSKFLVDRGLADTTIAGEVLSKEAVRKDDREPIMEGDFNVNSPIYEVARRYRAYNRALNDVEGDIALELSGGAEWRHDQHDKPIKVGGKTYPSPVRLAWAEQIAKGQEEDPEYEQRALAELATGTWEGLSDFEKELVGRRPAEGTSEGWFVYNAIADALRGNITKEDVKGLKVGKQKWSLAEMLPEPLPAGDQEVDERTRRSIARFVNGNVVEGFTKDFVFSEEPKYRRVQRLSVVTKSKFKKDWNDILQIAHGANRVIEDIRSDARSDYTITEIQDHWDNYVKTSLLPWLESDMPPEFQREVAAFGPEFLYTLLD